MPDRRSTLRKPSCALLLAAGCLAWLLPQPASAWKLWERQRPSRDQAQAARETASQPQSMATPSSGLREEPMSTAMVSGAFGSAASLLGAPRDGADPRSPSELSRLGHERRKLDPVHDELMVSGDTQSMAQSMLQYGNLLAQLGYDADAALAFQRTLQLDPQLLAARSNMGALLRRAGFLNEARSVFSSVLSENPRSASTWFNLAMTEDALGNASASDEAYVQALRLDSSLWLPSYNPLIVGNRRANNAIHLNYLAKRGGDKILLDGGR